MLQNKAVSLLILLALISVVTLSGCVNKSDRESSIGYEPGNCSRPDKDIDDRIEGHDLYQELG